MFAFFGEIAGFFEAAWNYFTNFVESLVLAVSMMASASGFATMLVQYVPSILGASITIFIVIYTIKLLTGR